MIEHLLELRKRVIYSLIIFIALFTLFFTHSNFFFHLLLSPLRQVLPDHQSLIAVNITTALFTSVSIAAHLAFFVTIPCVLFHFWRFVAPALYGGERRQLKSLIAFSLILFALGVLFCFYGVLPFMFQFFMQAVPSEVKLLPDMMTSLHFVLQMLYLFGLCFQVPLICMVLVKWGWLSVEGLLLVRPYYIVGAFVLGMLLTPPDVFSQVMLALPLCALYELGVFCARYQNRRTALSCSY